MPDPHRGDHGYRRVLWAVLAINAVMFAVEVAAGLAAGSASLQADALDFRVFGTGTGWPDVIVAAIMASLALQGAWMVLKQSLVELRKTTVSPQAA